MKRNIFDPQIIDVELTENDWALLIIAIRGLQVTTGGDNDRLAELEQKLLRAYKSAVHYECQQSEEGRRSCDLTTTR